METAATRQDYHSLWILGLVVLLGMEAFALSQGVDAYSLTLEGGAEGFRSLFAQMGNLLKILVVFAVAAGLMLERRSLAYFEQLRDSWQLHRLRWLVPQVISFAALVMITQQVFGDPARANEVAAGWFWAWLAAAAATFVFWLLALASPAFARDFIRTEWRVLAIALAIGLCVWLVAMATRELWGPLSQWTFILVALLLLWVEPEGTDAWLDERIIGVHDFHVNIAPACSGYEGMGLVAAFVSIYLYTQRHRLRWGRALLLYPLGITAVWLLNVLRIAFLILLGAYVSPEVAVGGFHSYAGWIAFIATALALLWIADRSQWLRKAEPAPAPVAPAPAAAAPRDPAAAERNIACLVPLVALLASSILTSAFSADFNWLYPVRVVAVAAALVWALPRLQLGRYRPGALPIVAGLAGAIGWAWLLGRSPEADSAFQAALDGAPPLWAGLWLAARLIGTAVTVPLAEELAFRGYLLCRFAGRDAQLSGPLPFSLGAVVLSSVLFGALHGAFVAGALAGLLYAWVRLRGGHILDAVLAHAITNFALFGYAYFTGVWSVI